MLISNGVGHKEDVSLVWTSDGSGGGTLTGSTADIATVFTLTVDKFGDYTFCLKAPLAHTFTDDPNQAGTQTEFEDNLQIAFTYTATDGDGDQADALLTINVDDDVPTLCIDTFQGEGSGSVAIDVIHDETPGSAVRQRPPRTTLMAAPPSPSMAIRRRSRLCSMAFQIRAMTRTSRVTAQSATRRASMVSSTSTRTLAPTARR